MFETLPAKSIEWLGMGVKAQRIDGIDLVTLANLEQNGAYQDAIRRISSQAKLALKRVEGLGLFNPQIPTEPFTLQLAILPRKNFEKILFEGLEKPEDWIWAQVCVRTLNKFCDTVVYDASIASKDWESDSTILPNEFRELHHELIHPMINNSLPAETRNESIKEQVVFHEMVAELIPRVLLGIQHRDIESTKFLLTLSRSDVLPLSVVNERGYGCFPAKPLRVNPIYGGIFLAGLAGVDILGGGDFLNGTRKMIRTAQRCKSPDNLWVDLGRDGLDTQWFLDTTEPVEKGQQVLEKIVS